MYQCLCFGQCCLFLSCFFCGLRAGFKSIAVVAGLEDVAAMREAIQERGRHLCISEDLGPF